jgi:hypothetical protein
MCSCSQGILSSSACHLQQTWGALDPRRSHVWHGPYRHNACLAIAPYKCYTGHPNHWERVRWWICSSSGRVDQSQGHRHALCRHWWILSWANLPRTPCQLPGCPGSSQNHPRREAGRECGCHGRKAGGIAEANRLTFAPCRQCARKRTLLGSKYYWKPTST